MYQGSAPLEFMMIIRLRVAETKSRNGADNADEPLHGLGMRSWIKACPTEFIQAGIERMNGFYAFGRNEIDHGITRINADLPLRG